MNRLKGKIEAISSHDELMLLEINTLDTKMKAIIIGQVNDYPYLNIGCDVMVLFKETEVVISKGKELKISLQNNLTCTITSIEKGELLSQVHLNFKDISLSSIITTKSVERLNLKPQDTVAALIKTNELIISEC